MYACGPTVYARAHIGNFRTYVCLDVLRRTLKYVSGYDVREAINYTDVDDKTIAGANEAGVPLREYTEQWIQAFRDDAAAVGDRGAGRNASRDRRAEPARDGRHDSGPRAQRPYLQARRVDLLPHCELPAVRPAGQARPRGDAGRRERGRGRVLQRQSARLRAVERGASRRAVVGLRDRPRSPRLAHRVLRDGAAAAWRAADRHPCGWHRPRLSASRERDRAERGRQQS